MHEAINSYLDFLSQPHVKETGVVSFVEHAPVPQPVPSVGSGIGRGGSK